jgi:hypothetical protein
MPPNRNIASLTPELWAVTHYRLRRLDTEDHQWPLQGRRSLEVRRDAQRCTDAGRLPNLSWARGIEGDFVRRFCMRRDRDRRRAQTWILPVWIQDPAPPAPQKRLTIGMPLSGSVMGDFSSIFIPGGRCLILSLIFPFINFIHPHLSHTNPTHSAWRMTLPLDRKA